MVTAICPDATARYKRSDKSRRKWCPKTPNERRYVPHQSPPSVPSFIYAHARVGARAHGHKRTKLCPVAKAENALNPSLKMTPKEQFIEAANMMCGYSREDLAMLSEKGLIQVIDGFLVLAEEPEKRGNPEICRWAKRLRELRAELMEGSQ